MKFQVWISSLHFKFEFQVWIPSLNFKFDFQVWISSLNFKFEFRIWISSLNCKFEFQVWISSLNFKSLTSLLSRAPHLVCVVFQESSSILLVWGLSVFLLGYLTAYACKMFLGNAAAIYFQHFCFICVGSSFGDAPASS